MKVTTLFDLGPDVRRRGSDAARLVSLAKESMERLGRWGFDEARHAGWLRQIDGTILIGRFTSEDVAAFNLLISSMITETRQRHVANNSPTRERALANALEADGLRQEFMDTLGVMLYSAVTEGGPQYAHDDGWIFLGKVPPVLGDGVPTGGWLDLWAFEQPSGRLALLRRHGDLPHQYMSREETPERWLEMLSAGGKRTMDTTVGAEGLDTRGHLWLDSVRLAIRKGLVPTSAPGAALRC